MAMVMSWVPLHRRHDCCRIADAAVAAADDLAGLVIALELNVEVLGAVLHHLHSSIDSDPGATMPATTQWQSMSASSIEVAVLEYGCAVVGKRSQEGHRRCGWPSLGRLSARLRLTKLHPTRLCLTTSRSLGGARATHKMAE